MQIVYQRYKKQQCHQHGYRYPTDKDRYLSIVHSVEYSAYRTQATMSGLTTRNLNTLHGKNKLRYVLENKME